MFVMFPNLSTVQENLKTVPSGADNLESFITLFCKSLLHLFQAIISSRSSRCFFCSAVSVGCWGWGATSGWGCSTTFCGLQLQVSKKVLAPRDVTEQMVTDFIASHKNATYLKVLDLCCGCGCIGISIKKHLPQTDVTCIDKYWQPLFDTNTNAIKNKTALTIDKYDAINYLNHRNSLDILISNPPYVNANNFNDKHMYKYESKKALIASDNGLYFYKQYFKWLDKHTFKEAWLEYGYDQRQTLKDILANYPSLEYVMSDNNQYIVIKPKN